MEETISPEPPIGNGLSHEDYKAEQKHAYAVGVVTPILQNRLHGSMSVIEDGQIIERTKFLIEEIVKILN